MLVFNSLSALLEFFFVVYSTYYIHTCCLRELSYSAHLQQQYLSIELEHNTAIKTDVRRCCRVYFRKRQDDLFHL